MAANEVESVELLWLDLHLRHDHRTATGSEHHRPVVMVRAVVGGVEGFGECAALAAPTYAEEYAAGAWDVLANYLVPRLLRAGPVIDRVPGPASATPQTCARADHGATCQPPAPFDGHATSNAVAAVGSHVARATHDVVGHRMAKAALEMAVLDATLRLDGTSLAGALGVTVRTVEAGAVTGLPLTIEDLEATIESLAGVGYRRIKVKIEPGWDIEPLRRLRERFPYLQLQADANGSYHPGDRHHRERLKAFDDLGLLCLEQPYPAGIPGELAALAELAAALETPVCIDESATSPARVAEAVKAGACDMVCVKPGRLGGIGAAVRVHDWAFARDVPVWVGGMLETTFARSVNAALAGLPGFTLPGDLTSVGFSEPDPSGSPPGTPPHVDVHCGPGVGPPPEPELLARVVTQRVGMVPR
jgi:o-succinylbenzoate synthase